ncbi:MAG: glycogen/starch synthase [Bacteroidia bacterium]|nr:glycogen/starch synthase [Bacteroidia bacterium]
MDKKLRILYVTSEIDPFLKLTSAADLIRLLPQRLQEKGHEIRIFMPKFGVINERRNRLHEVVRLSGINIRVAGEEKPLTIKVASIPNAKLQVYFLDNEDYFKRKSVLTDPSSNVFHIDNDERAIFFCKGVIETARKLGWPPDIIHCHDWMSAFIPLYLRTTYKNDPMFKRTKTVFTVYNNGFEHEFSKNFIEKVKSDGIADEKLDNFSANTYVGVVKGGIALSDVVTKGSPIIDETLERYIDEVKSRQIYFDTADKDLYVENYNQLYADILN